jgi:hypothetical protein
MPFGWQLDMPGPMQRQQQAATHHVARLTVGLNPVPGLAYLERKSATTQARILGDQLAKLSDLRIPQVPASKTEPHVGHAAQFSGRNLERSSF